MVWNFLWKKLLEIIFITFRLYIKDTFFISKVITSILSIKKCDIKQSIVVLDWNYIFSSDKIKQL